MHKKIITSIVLFRHTPEQILPLILDLCASKYVEIIYIIDNGGCSWAKNINRKTVYLSGHGNIGYGAGHNLAIFHPMNKSDFHIICNPDIRIPQDTLEKVILFSEQSSAALFMPKILYPDGRPQELCKLLPTPLDLFARRFLRKLASTREDNYLLRMADFSKPFFAPYLSGCFMFIKTQALREIGGFDERYFMYLEDTDLSRRLARKYGAYYYPGCLVYHEFQKGSYKSFKLLKAHITSAIQYFNKWGWLVDEDRKLLNNRCLAQFKHNEPK